MTYNDLNINRGRTATKLFTTINVWEGEIAHIEQNLLPTQRGPYTKNINSICTINEIIKRHYHLCQTIPNLI